MLIQEEYVLLGKITFLIKLVNELLFLVFTLSLQHVNEKRGLGLMGTIGYTSMGGRVPVGILMKGYNTVGWE